MNKFLASLIFLPATLLAQKNVHPVNTAEAFERGIKFHDEEKYSEALEEYEKISINDTNYANAQYEMALTSSAMKNYDKSIGILNELLGYEINYKFKYQVYLQLGNSYDEKGDSQKALEAYGKGLELYPYQHNLLYNRGICYEKMGRYNDAAADYQSAICANRFYTSAHVSLGKLALRMGLYDQGMLSIVTAAWLSPETTVNQQGLSTLEQFSEGSYDGERLPQTILPEDPYADYNEFFVNKTALQPNYKVKLTLKTAYARQLDLFLKNNRYDAENPDFWNQTYMQFLSDTYKAKKFDELIMISLSGISSDNITSTLKPKIGRLKAFYEWSRPVFSNIISYTYMEFEGKRQRVNTTYSNGLATVGRVKNGKEVGNHYNYYENGQLKLLARLDEEGKPNGEWDIYDEYGNKNRSLLLLNELGTDQVIKEYFDSGEVEYKYKKTNGTVNDTVYQYFRDGGVRMKYMVLADRKNGIQQSFYPNGTLAEEQNFKDGVADGPYRSWHPNGKPEDELTMKLGVVNGKRLTYYENGQLKSERNYKDDYLDGPFLEYFPDGSLSETGTYKKGSKIGVFKSFYANGKLDSEAEFDESGKENGTSVWYDTDEKKYERLTFSKGNLEKLEYIDKNGVVKPLAELKSRKIEFVNAYPDGRPKIQGTIASSERDGVWKYYDRYGLLTKKETYLKGQLVDTVFEYFATGQLGKMYVLKDGNYNGLYLEYNIFGDLIEEGMYEDNKLSGDWFTYNTDGTMKSHNFYANGERHGYQITYNPSGKITSVTQMDNGRTVFNRQLDTLENLLQEFGVYNGEVRFHAVNNKFDNLVGHYRDGMADGHFTFYYSTGNVEVEGDYLNNKKNGIWKYYYPNGKLKAEIPYLNGNYHGLKKEFHPNGKPDTEISFVLGAGHGPFTYYHENGQKRMSGTLFDGNRHGKVYSYGPKGEVYYIRNYDRGVIVSYTSLDAQEKEKPETIVTGNEMNVVTYYSSGKKAVEHRRVNGLLEGPYVIYHENGQKYEVENYLHDEIDGKKIQYNDAGTKVLEEDYVKGDLHGWSVEYHANGKVKSRTPYRYGQLHGTADEYSADGKLVKQIVYFDNDEIEVKTF